jgi:hypothetical protein
MATPPPRLHRVRLGSDLVFVCEAIDLQCHQFYSLEHLTTISALHAFTAFVAGVRHFSTGSHMAPHLRYPSAARSGGMRWGV